MNEVQPVLTYLLRRLKALLGHYATDWDLGELLTDGTYCHILVTHGDNIYYMQILDSVVPLMLVVSTGS
jgi:hypothetical protein